MHFFIKVIWNTELKYESEIDLLENRMNVIKFYIQAIQVGRILFKTNFDILNEYNLNLTSFNFLKTCFPQETGVGGFP